MRVIIVIAVFVLFNQTFAQAPDVKEPVSDALQKVSVMIGTWEGRGWVINQNREKKSSNVHESIQWKLDSTLILIEGTGTDDNGIVVHNALAVLGFDPFQKSYSMNSYLSSGLSTTADFKVLIENESFSWIINNKRGRTIKYTITINKDNQWKEIGEYSADNEKWNQFFEMNLKKVN